MPTQLIGVMTTGTPPNARGNQTPTLSLRRSGEPLRRVIPALPVAAPSRPHYRGSLREDALPAVTISLNA